MTTLTTLWRALESNYGLLVLAGMFYLVWKMSTWKGGIEHRLDNVEKTVEKYTEKTDEIYNIIVGRFGHGVGQTESPERLTEYGAELAGKIDARKIVDKYADAVYRETENMNAYQVQQHCFVFCRDPLMNDLEKVDRAYFDKISNLAFEEGLHLAEISYVLGLEMRDRVLQMREKSHAEAAEHSPA